MPQPQVTGVIRFGAFELDPRMRILRKHGVRIRLQEQPFRILLALLEKPGEVVTREELQQKIWPGNEFGDVDHSLNIAVNKIREALVDSAETSRFVETLPRLGYRFIAPVEGGAVSPADAVKPSRPRWIPLAGASVAAAALLAGGMGAWLLAPSPPTAIGWHRLTNDNLFPKSSPVLSDGTRLYFMAGTDSGRQIFQVPFTGGEPTRLAAALPPGQFHRLLDITPDGQELLFAVYQAPPTVPVSSVPLWTVRITDGSSRRMGNLHGLRATYSPDGTKVAVTAGGVAGSLWIASSEGSDARRVLELNDMEVVLPRWSPGGTRIAFGRRRLSTEDWSAWEIRADGTHLRRFLPEWRREHVPGLWTPGGGLLLISEGQFWMARPLRLLAFRPPPPLQLSAEEPFFDPPPQPRDGRPFHAIGRTRLGQLQRLDTRSGRWEPHMGGISAELAEYSRDGQRLTYTTYPGGQLWVRRADGSRPIQLTNSSLAAQLSRWSPDGNVIGFLGKVGPEQPWTIYLVDAAGGAPRLACRKGCGALTDFTWSPDGKKIVYSAPTSGSAEMHLGVLDLETGEGTKFPGSEGLHSPRWSPDGAMLAALTCECKVGSPFASIQPLALYRNSQAKWEELPSPGAGNPMWPSWSHDSESIWYWSLAQGTIVRYRIRENRHDTVLPLSRDEMTGLLGFWFGLTPNDEPMILRRRDMDQVYALDWKPR